MTAGAPPARLVIAGLAAATALCTSATSLAQQPGAAMPPPAVVVETIELKEVSDPAMFTGRVEAIEAVDIRARITGFLRSVKFRDGQAVNDGDMLFEVEPDQFAAAVASVRAQVARA